MVIKPILLINCLITDDVLSIYDRGLLVSHSKFDVFKYMLMTSSVLDFDRIYINYTLTEPYAARSEELEELIAESFPTAMVRTRRLERYGEWIDFIEDNAILAGPPILLMCNDDHIFLADDKAYFNKLLEGYQRLLQTGPLVSVIYSHWPESRRYHAPFSIIQTDPDYDICLSDNSHDGIQMLSPGLLRHWFYDDSSQFERETLVRRSEDLGRAKGRVFKILPKKELFRHFDGYSSAGIGIKQCSPLTIPAGFFDRTMKLCFANLTCQADVESLIAQGFTICSAATALVGGLAISQPVYDFTPETIPLAWVEHIAEVSYYGNYHETFGRKCRDVLREHVDFGRPARHSVVINRSGEYDLYECPREQTLRPYPGFHKTPTRSTKKSILLLQEARFYKKDDHVKAIESAASSLLEHGISLHLILLDSSNVLLQGKLFVVLNNFLGRSHPYVDSVMSLNCSESLRSSDLAHFIENTYGETNFCICHNADPVKGLPIMIDVLANNESYFPNDHGSISFIAAGIPNMIAAPTNMLISNTHQFKVACQSERSMGPDLMESLLLQMEEEKMGLHSAKILPKRP
jgi:hypothetical protein